MAELVTGTQVRIKEENGDVGESATPVSAIRSEVGVIQGTHSSRGTAPVGESGELPEHTHFTYLVSVDGQSHIIDEGWLEETN